MIPLSRPRSAVLLAATLLLAGSCSPSPQPDAPDAARSPVYGDPFWSHWGDGQAELAVYDLTFPRYGEPRAGVAVAIFVTETFDAGARVKHQRAGRPPEALFPVMKLNLIEDFRTGIYDYNLMTSAFVALEPVNGRPAGSPTKVSFSSQEWCGHVYSQALFDAGQVRLESHSYFEAEADDARTLALPAAGLAEDTLLLWARGVAGPVLEPGERIEVPSLRSLQRVRLRHVEPAVEPVTLSRAAEVERVAVPAGEFQVERLTAEIDGVRTWTFLVEMDAPRRIVAWHDDAGYAAELRGTRRLAYWQLTGPAHDRALEELGL